MSDDNNSICINLSDASFSLLTSTSVKQNITLGAAMELLFTKAAKQIKVEEANAAESTDETEQTELE